MTDGGKGISQWKEPDIRKGSTKGDFIILQMKFWDSEAKCLSKAPNSYADEPIGKQAFFPPKSCAFSPGNRHRTLYRAGSQDTYELILKKLSQVMITGHFSSKIPNKSFSQVCSFSIETLYQLCFLKNSAYHSLFSVPGHLITTDHLRK